MALLPPPQGGGGLFSSFLPSVVSFRLVFFGVGFGSDSLGRSLIRSPWGYFYPEFLPLAPSPSRLALSHAVLALSFALCGTFSGWVVDLVGWVDLVRPVACYYIMFVGCQLVREKKRIFAPVLSLFFRPLVLPSVSLVRSVSLVSDCIRKDRPYLLGGLFVVFGFSLPNT